MSTALPPAPPPPQRAAPRGGASASGQPAAPRDPGLRSAALRTLQALLGTALGILPLGQMFSDSGWIVDAWLTMIIVIVPAALLRLRARPSALHIWLGVLLAVGWLTARFVPTNAIGGFIPWYGAWQDVTALLRQLHDTVTNGVAPVPSTPAVRFTLCVALAALVVLVDLIAVVLRRGALAGVPLLIVFTVAGAVPRHPVNWLLFIAAAAGFLLLLGLDANDDLRSWGRLMPRAGVSRPAISLGVSAQRIAVLAIAAAVILPLVAPSTPTNLIANAFHHGGSGSSGGFGANSISLDPFAALKGNLVQPKTVNLFTVTLSAKPQAPLFYARSNVLQHVSSTGWSATDHGSTIPLGNGYPTLPASADRARVTGYVAHIEISGLGGNPPVFGRPEALSGLPDKTRWSPQDQLLLDSEITRGDQYTEQIAQPYPTTQQLQQAPGGYSRQFAPWLQLPGSIPRQVISLVDKLTATASSPYEIAAALQTYFTDPANGFFYTLHTTSGDSGSDLVDFLTNKGGFCQQFAAAMGIMLRIAGVPARVVLGYTHPVPDDQRSFTVTTNDAHAWVEAYFNDIGWVPFDPTPLAGIDGGAAADLPWASHGVTGAGASSAQTTDPVAHPTTGSSSATAPAAAAASAADHGADLWPVVWTLVAILIVIALVLLPATARWLRRRRRLRAARSGNPDPLWAELSATAVDLGYVWSHSRSPRQVVSWLGSGSRSAAPAGSLTRLASAVELARYAPAEADRTRADARQLVQALHEVETRLRAGRSRAARLHSRLAPASLGWRWLPGAGRRRRLRPRRR